MAASKRRRKKSPDMRALKELAVEAADFSFTEGVNPKAARNDVKRGNGLNGLSKRVRKLFTL